jgi:uncharacterized cupredoxin-like copper-binding protein
MKAIGIAIAAALTMSAASVDKASADTGHFSAGRPGNPKKPARTVTVVMRDDNGTMKYEPERLDVKKGEQIRFVIENKGVLKHEFILATVPENKKHGELMKKHPHMEHDDPNSKSVEPGRKTEMLWQFTKAGTFEFACLIPGHYEAGMHGTATVK